MPAYTSPVDGEGCCGEGFLGYLHVNLAGLEIRLFSSRRFQQQNDTWRMSFVLAIRINVNFM